MRITLIAGCCGIFSVLMLPSIWAADFEELDPAYYHAGELAGSLRAADAPALGDADPQHVWNRLYAAVHGLIHIQIEVPAGDVRLYD